MADWLVRQGGSPPIGPVSTELVIRGIEAGRVLPSAEACRVGQNDWLPLDLIPEFAGYAVDEDAATRVTDSPWFMNDASAVTRSAPTPRVVPPSGPQSVPKLGLPPPKRGPPGPPPKRRAPPPRPPRSSRPIASSVTFQAPPATGPPRIARHSYDDNRSAGADDFPVDDETVTRVAAPPPGAPGTPDAGGGGVLPTLPMHVLKEMQSDLATRAIPSPRPAAGAPPPASLRQPDIIPPTRPFLERPAPPPTTRDGSFPMPPGVAPTPYPPPAQPYYATRPPGQYAPDAQGPAQYPPQYPQPPAPAGPDQSLRALVVLIVVLAIALAAVLVALILRR